jgi:hypothetical protein
VLPRAARWGGDDSQDEALLQPAVQATLSYYQDVLVKAYGIYATSDKTNFMTFQSMLHFAHDFFILDTDISVLEMGVLFLRCKGAHAENSLLSHTRNKLTFQEFTQAVGRSALVGLAKKYPVSPEDLVKGLFMHISQCMLRSTRDNRYSAFFKPAAPAVLVLHRLFRDLWVRDRQRNYLFPRGTEELENAEVSGWKRLIIGHRISHLTPDICAD